jgi:hypothetical protein
MFIIFLRLNYIRQKATKDIAILVKTKVKKARIQAEQTLNIYVNYN